MARNVIFLVHGIGVHDADWWHEPADTLRAAARQYPSLANGIDDRIEFVGIRYDDLFDTVLRRWSELTQGLQGTAMPGVLDKITDALDELDNPKEVVRYGGDVALYKGFDLVARTVRLRVMAAFTRKVTEVLDSDDSDVRFGVIAHSLGTAVAHDALDDLARGRWITPSDVENEVANLPPADAEAYRRVVSRMRGNPFSPEGGFYWNALFMVANTSPLLHTTAKGPYASRVNPLIPPAGDGICRRYYNVLHPLDPVCLAGRFSTPPAWANVELGTDLEVNHIHAPNIHGFSHYLKHPKVHRRVFSRFAGHFDRDDVAKGKALEADFPRVEIPGLDRAGIQSALERIIAKGPVTDAAGLMERVRTFATWLEGDPITNGY